MAEQISEIFKIIIEKLISGAIDFVQAALEINSQLKDHEKMMTSIEVSLLDPDALQLSNSQIEMLKQLSVAVEKMHRFQDERESRAKRRKITNPSNLAQKVLFYFAYSLHTFNDARQLASISRDLIPLAREKDEIHNLLDILTQPQKPRNSDSTIESLPDLSIEEVIGRDRDRDEILRMLDSTGNLNVIPITGIGGIGKTNLAQYVCNDQWVKSNFDVMIWVHVGQAFDSKEILQKVVAFIAADKNLGDCDMPQLQNRVISLIGSKKCLIFLDNVWDGKELGSNWQELMKLFRFMDHGSRFIITTRSDSVARTLSNTNPYKLEDLEEEQDAWRLFQKVVFRVQQPEPQLEEIGREIAKLCGNVPLVIHAIGGLLREKPTTVLEWGNFRDDLARTSCCDHELSIKQTLKLSYDELHPEGMKRCFVLCSLFPKAFSIRKDDLMYLWRALGFVETRENQSGESTTEQYLVCLINRGLLIDSRYSIRMHCVIHELAISLGKSKYKLADFDGCEFGEETRHLCFRRKNREEEEFPSSSVFQIKDQLKSLLLWDTYSFTNLKLKELSNFERLIVFRVSGAGLKEVPSTIGKLIHLRYLDLSGNPFTELPDSITQLVNLLFLKLEFCRELKKLPSDLWKLVDLEFLSLLCCENLRELPRDINKIRHIELFGCLSLSSEDANRASQ